MSDAVQTLLAARRDRVTHEQARLGCDALFVCDPSLAWWLTGSRDVQRAWLSRDGALDLDPHGSWIAEQRPTRLAYVGHADWEVVSAIRAMQPEAVVNFAESFAAARRRKDPFEVAMLTQASDITRQALRSCSIDLNSDEVTFASALYRRLRLGGAEGWAYDPSVASGQSAALSWSAPSPTIVMGEQTHTVIDAAGELRGYKADCTVALIRSADSPYDRDDVKRLADVIASAIDDLGTGLDSAAELSLRANRALEASGYDKMPHAFGHGLGLQLHEHPYITVASSHTLAPGDVFTLEPATYAAGHGGVRLETTVRIGDDGSIIQLLDAFDLTEKLQTDLEEMT